jgi:2'-5' RNA ligase
MRLFVALELSETVRSALIKLVQQLRGAAADVRWVRPEGMHLTLKFIGEMPAEKLPPIKAALRGATSPAPVHLDFQGLGYFPNQRRPRVFWVGVHASDNLAPLAAQVEDLLSPLGIVREKRAYAPHLTLGRFKSADGLERLQQLIAALSSTRFGQCDADSFVLYQSRLSPKGAEYTKLEEFAFVRS